METCSNAGLAAGHRIGPNETRLLRLTDRCYDGEEKPKEGMFVHSVVHHDYYSYLRESYL